MVYQFEINKPRPGSLARRDSHPRQRQTFSIPVRPNSSSLESPPLPRSYIPPLSPTSTNQHISTRLQWYPDPLEDPDRSLYLLTWENIKRDTEWDSYGRRMQSQVVEPLGLHFGITTAIFFLTITTAHYTRGYTGIVHDPILSTFEGAPLGLAPTGNPLHQPPKV
jgi:hypothetical protein